MSAMDGYSLYRFTTIDSLRKKIGDAEKALQDQQKDAARKRAFAEGLFAIS